MGKAYVVHTGNSAGSVMLPGLHGIQRYDEGQTVSLTTVEVGELSAAMLADLTYLEDIANPQRPPVESGGADSPLAIPSMTSLVVADRPDSGGNPMNVLEVDTEGGTGDGSGYTPIFAFQLKDDAFPRMLITAGKVFIGNGAHDPINDEGASIEYTSDGRLYLSAKSGQPVATGSNPFQFGHPAIKGWMLIPYDPTHADAIVLTAPDGTFHALQVANDGTLSTAVVS